MASHEIDPIDVDVRDSSPVGCWGGDGLPASVEEASVVD